MGSNIPQEEAKYVFIFLIKTSKIIFQVSAENLRTKAKMISENNPNLTATQIETMLMLENRDNVVMLPSRSEIRNIVKNVCLKDQIEEIPFLKNVKLLSTNDFFFQKYYLSSNVCVNTCLIFIIFLCRMIINRGHKFIIFSSYFQKNVLSKNSNCQWIIDGFFKVPRGWTQLLVLSIVLPFEKLSFHLLMFLQIPNQKEFMKRFLKLC